MRDELAKLSAQSQIPIRSHVFEDDLKKDRHQEKRAAFLYPADRRFMKAVVAPAKAPVAKTLPAAIKNPKVLAALGLGGLGLGVALGRRKHKQQRPPAQTEDMYAQYSPAMYQAG
jgi:hypothetical protein